MVSDNKVYVVTSERIPAGSELRLKAEESHLNSCGLAAKYYNNTECELCGIDYKRPFFLQVSGHQVFISMILMSKTVNQLYNCMYVLMYE